VGVWGMKKKKKNNTWGPSFSRGGGDGNSKGPPSHPHPAHTHAVGGWPQNPRARSVCGFGGPGTTQGGFCHAPLTGLRGPAPGPDQDRPAPVIQFNSPNTIGRDPQGGHDWQKEGGTTRPGKAGGHKKRGCGQGNRPGRGTEGRPPPAAKKGLDVSVDFPPSRGPEGRGRLPRSSQEISIRWRYTGRQGQGAGRRKRGRKAGDDGYSGRGGGFGSIQVQQKGGGGGGRLVGTGTSRAGEPRGCELPGPRAGPEQRGGNGKPTGTLPGPRA